MGRSLVQRSPIKCGVSDCDGEASIMRRTWPIGGWSAMGNYFYCFITISKSVSRFHSVPVIKGQPTITIILFALKFICSHFECYHYYYHHILCHDFSVIWTFRIKNLHVDCIWVVGLDAHIWFLTRWRNLSQAFFFFFFFIFKTEFINPLAPEFPFKI